MADEATILLQLRGGEVKWALMSNDGVNNA